MFFGLNSSDWKQLFVWISIVISAPIIWIIWAGVSDILKLRQQKKQLLKERDDYENIW